MKLRKYVRPRNIIDFISLIFSFIMIPIGYWYFVFVVLPSIYPSMSFLYLFHFFLSTFFMVNITSNFLYVILQDCSIAGEIMPSIPPKDWTYCIICESVVPPRSFHCSVCDICILRRDHHCQFAACCIGHQNLRYFILFLFHLSVSSFYTIYFHTVFIIQNTTFSLLGLTKFIFPLGFLALGIDNSIEQVYTLLYVLNIIFMILSTFLFLFHIVNILRGTTTFEHNYNIDDYNTGSIQENLKLVAGNHWYLTWLSPFVHSNLPHDGINWTKCNVKDD